MHRAARIEDAFHEFRARRARKRGFLATVVPYTGYGAPTWVRILGRVVLAKDPRPGSRAERLHRKREESVRGWRSFVSVPLADVTVTVEIEGEPPRGDDRPRRRHRHGHPGAAHARAGTPSGSSTAESTRVFEAPVFIIDPKATFGIISDVDDTVMVTALPRPLLAAWNTFVLDEHARVPTPGMSVLLERLAAAHPGTPVIYLSTGAWNVAPTLTRFLSRNLFPAGPLLLTDWGPTHDRLFRSGREHKRTSLERLAAGVPRREVAADRRRRPARRRPLRRVHRRAPGERRGRRHPAAVERRGGARRWPLEGREAQRAVRARRGSTRPTAPASASS